MKRRALEGVYLLAYFEKQNKYDYDTYKDMIIEVVDNREDISEARDIFDIYYKQSLCFLNRCIPWYRLKTPLRNTIAYFEKYSNNKYEINNYADEYFKKIEIEYNQKKIRNEEHLLDGEKYIRIYDFEFDENNQVQLYMSIVTNSIIEYDNTMLSEDNNKKGYYRPYFVEFISDYINKEDFKRLEIDINSEDSQWKKINFVEGEYKGNNPCIPGTFIFSASPLKIDKRKIEITNCKIPDKVKNFNLDLRSIRDNVFNSERKKELNNKLKEIFPTSYKKCEISIFNVGQGSFNLIEMDNKKFIFDVGYSRNNGEKIEKQHKERSNKLIKSIKPDCVILSHWDLDHILGITNMTDKVFDTCWIVPDISNSLKKKNFSDSAKRLLCFLAWYDKTNLIAISSSKTGGMDNTIIFSNNVFEIGKGSSKTYISEKSQYLCGEINSLNYQNNFGLLLKIMGQREQIIFPGDCEYNAFPQNFMTQFPNYLVVPHHGSKMLFNVSICNSRVKFAFISSGKNAYECKCEKACKAHPHKCHINFLKEGGYNIYETAMSDYYKFKLE